MSHWTPSRTRWLVLAALLAIGVVPAGAPAQAAGSVIFVRATATGANNGASWQDAYTNLQTALGAATSGDQIWVAKGSYPTTTGTDQSVSFALKAGVALYGGFAGRERRLGQRDPAANLTILTGDIGNQGDQTDNARHVVDASYTQRSTVLDGFKIIGGYNFNDTTGGGGILVVNGSPTLRNLLVTGHTGYTGMGVSVSGGGAPLLTNVVIANNFSGGGYGVGGGMTSYASSPVLRNVTFSDNRGNFGGGLYANGGSPSLTNVTFSGNTGPTTSGGALMSENAATTVVNSVLWGNDGTEVSIAGTPAASFEDSIIDGGCPASATCRRVRDADPALGPLIDNGGAVPTRALGRGSAAIDAGRDATCATTDARGVARPQGGTCDVGAFEVRALAFGSQAAYDGWVLESSRTSGRGGSVDSRGATLRVGDDARDRQYRSVLSFDTAALPNGASVIRSTLIATRTSVSGFNPFLTHGAMLADLRQGPFGGSRTLAAGDFQATASRPGAGTVAAVSGRRYEAILAEASLDRVSKSSITQLRLRFSLDDDRDRRADYVSFASGKATPAKRPRLVVYYLP